MKNLNFSVSNTSVLGILPIVLLVLSSLLPTTATASYQFHRSTTCKGVQQHSPYDPIHETADFAQDETIYAWMKLNNVHGYVKGKFVWIKPNGQTYATSTTSQVHSNGGKVVFYALQKFYSLHGQWKVKFLISHNTGGYTHHSTIHINYGGGCVCPAVYDPVCGSNGKTYSNACEAQCAGVQVDYQGPCVAACICPAVVNPVCGSDGNTYNNACEAACAGVDVVSQGACASGSTCDKLAVISLNPDLCSQCLNEIAVYKFKGKNYLVFDGREAGGADCMTTVESCKTGSNSIILCREGGIAGFTECSDINFFSKAQKVQVVLEDDCSSSATCACDKPTANNWCDDFQSYDPWQKLGPQSKCWTTWTGVEGGNKDGIIQRNNDTKNQFMKIKGNNPHGGGHQDVLLKLGNRKDGCYHLDFEIWLFSGHKGYFNIMHRHNISNPSNHQWASQVYFDGNGTGRLQVQGYHYPFHYGMGKWIKVSQHFDMDNDLTELYIDGRRVHRWKFSVQSANGHPGVNKLNSISFYPRDQYHEFYIDDIKFEKAANLTDRTAESESRNGDAEDTSSEAFAFVDDSEIALTVTPNPFQHALTIQIPAGAQNGELTIFDQFGRLVRQLPAIEEATAQTINLDVSDLATGVYYVRLAAEGQVLTEKIVKQ